MSKKLGPKTNFRVTVQPRSLGDFGGVRVSTSLLYGHSEDEVERMRRDEEGRANEIANGIRRHVDNVGSAHVEFDQEHVCEHCGSAWTEKSNSYNGGCCAKDEEANPEVLAELEGTE